MIYINKKYISILLLLNTYLANAIVAEKRPWTFITYIAGDNNLEPFINFNIKAMQKGTNDNVHTLVFANTHRKGEPKVSRRLVITKQGITQDGPDIPNLDSGDRTTFIKAVKWGMSNYPSDKIAVVLWNHGSGYRFLGNTIKNYNNLADKESRIRMRKDLDKGVAYDDTTGNHLTDVDLQQSLATLTAKYKKEFDIIAFDACLMATAEIAFIIKPYAKYCVASQETIPGTGFDYSRLLQGLNGQDLTPQDFAIWMVNAYDAYYQRTSEAYTLAAINLHALDPVIENIASIAQLLTKNITNSYAVKMISSASSPANCVRFEEPGYMDLSNFYQNLSKNIPAMQLTAADKIELKQLLTYGINAINQAIINYKNSPKLSKAHGLSIYLPWDEALDLSYKQLIWSKQVPAWYKFISGYKKNSKRTDNTK